MTEVVSLGVDGGLNLRSTEETRLRTSHDVQSETPIYTFYCFRVRRPATTSGGSLVLFFALTAIDYPDTSGV